MGINTVPPAVGRTRFLTTLVSGTSYTVPAGVTYINVTLRGGGGGGAGITAAYPQGTSANVGLGGQIVSSTLSTTPGASIVYAIGAGGSAGSSSAGGAGGTTSFTGATSAVGGNGGTITIGTAGTSYLSAINGGDSGIGDGSNARTGGAGGVGSIDVEYWA